MSEINEVNGGGGNMPNKALIASVADMVNHPPHYQLGKFEAIELVKIIVNSHAGLTPVQGYLIGCALKYLMRFSRKDGLRDLRKAARCIEMCVEDMEGTQ